MPAGSVSRLALKLAAVVAVLFGIATVASGGSVLFGDGAKSAGNYVPFIVWFNFLAGFRWRSRPPAPSPRSPSVLT